ncbi:TIGR02587 family membrane protein [Euzebya sp.]|uniref:TIGR02587 family membrane protein n=1 Tax=Euzebya sp. TaxID=1971409 RepID=UPI003514760E
MSAADQPHVQPPGARELGLGVARAVAGALILGLPLLMTLEMWDLALTLSPWRLVVFVALALPALVVLVRYLGFRDERGLPLRDVIADALVAYGVGALTSVVVLTLLGVTDSARTPAEWLALVAVQSVPTSVGAAIARSHFVHGPGASGGTTGYGYEVLLMAVGALSLNVSIAPTEEVVLIAARVADPRALVLMAASLAGMHAVVYLLGFAGQHRADAPGWSTFVGYTVVGYAVACAISAYLLWVFGRTDAVPLSTVVLQVVVLAVPGSLGAAAARVIL